MLAIWWGLRLMERARVLWTSCLFLPMLAGLLGFFPLAASALPADVPAKGVELDAPDPLRLVQHYMSNIAIALLAISLAIARG